MKRKLSFDGVEGVCNFHTMISANGQVHGIFIINGEEEIRFTINLDDLIDSKFEEIATEYKNDTEVLYG